VKGGGWVVDRKAMDISNNYDYDYDCSKSR
jgi:hypothetical protein